MESLASTIRKMSAARHAPVQQLQPAPTPVVTEQNSKEFDYAAETSTEESRLIAVPGKATLIPEDHQGVSPMTTPASAVFEARARTMAEARASMSRTPVTSPRPDIPALVESDTTRYLKPKHRQLPLPQVIKEDAEPPAMEYEDSKAILATGKVKPNVDDSKFQPKFKSVQEYVAFSRNKRAQYQLKVIDNA